MQLYDIARMKLYYYKHAHVCGHAHVYNKLPRTPYMYSTNCCTDFRGCPYVSQFDVPLQLNTAHVAIYMADLTYC